METVTLWNFQKKKVVLEGLSAIPNLMLHITQRQAAVRPSVTYSFSGALFQNAASSSL